MFAALSCTLQRSKHGHLASHYCLPPLVLYLVGPPLRPSLFPRADDLKADPLFRPIELHVAHRHPPPVGFGRLSGPGIFWALVAAARCPPADPSRAQHKLVRKHGHGWRRSWGMHHLPVQDGARGRDKRAPLQSPVPWSLPGQVARIQPPELPALPWFRGSLEGHLRARRGGPVFQVLWFQFGQWRRQMVASIDSYYQLVH